jgi:hypothetical protein
MAAPPHSGGIVGLQSRQETGDRRQESGVRSQESGYVDTIAEPPTRRTPMRFRTPKRLYVSPLTAPDSNLLCHLFHFSARV